MNLLISIIIMCLSLAPFIISLVVGLRQNRLGLDSKGALVSTIIFGIATLVFLGIMILKMTEKYSKGKDEDV